MLISYSRCLRGFTLVELLVVISIIAVLAGLLVPATSMVMTLARQIDDGNDLRQIHMASQVYASNHDQAWPAVYVSANGSVSDRAGADPQASAIASFELLAFESGVLPNQLFQSKGLSSAMPRGAAGDIITTGTSTWAANASSDPSQMPAYAYDWSVPASAHPMRIVLATRGHGIYNGTVVTCNATGAVGKLQSRRDQASSNGSYQLQDLKLRDQAAWVTYNTGLTDPAADNIFDDGDDDGYHMTIGFGSEQRAALK